MATSTATPNPQPVDHPTIDERVAKGKAQRKRVPRKSHGEWTAPSDRHPIELLEAQASSRVADLVPIRYGRMAVSPFTFYRGAANVIAADLNAAPHSGLDVQLCGDAHLSNFGGFASAERSLVFDLNDFDETLPGPFEWDVKRLVASFEVAARDLGLEEDARSALVASTTKSYRDAMRSFAAMTNLDVWYLQLDVEQIVARWGAEASNKALKNLQRTVTKAESKDRLKALAKLTHEVDGELQFISDPPLIVPVEEVFSDVAAQEVHTAIHNALRMYRRTLSGDRRRLLETYRFVHLARKVVGVGSVGMRSWVALLVGRDNTDPLFLQVKEATASVMEPFLKRSTYSNHGQRVVEGQRLMQASGDIFLGWQRVDGMDGVTHDYYMRQLWDWKASANIDAMTPELLSFYGQVCGWTLARAHAKSGDAIAISEYLGTSASFDNAMVAFASAYADQNERDFAELTAAIAAGRITAQAGI